MTKFLLKELFRIKLKIGYIFNLYIKYIFATLIKFLDLRLKHAASIIVLKQGH